MLFNSSEFLVFLCVVFALYWSIDRERINLQNILILLASYVFYGWWDWKFLLLIIFSSLVDYTIGRLLGRQDKPKIRKLLLYISLIVNLGLLAIFKYFNFFISEFNELMGSVGLDASLNSLNLILPVGISFYTFQSLSYSIDVYKRKLKPSKNLVQFLTYVAFFPQLVAGPIERAKTLLPQFEKARYFNYDFAVKGVHQIIWGFFKKVVIADNCAILVNQIFNQEAGYSGSSSLLLIFGAILFAFQIYGDFSGYSDIAIGTAKLFGIQLMKNFDFPYFSRDIAEFWRKWHISLSTWFKDYVYFPLGGSRGGKYMTLRNVFAIFLVSGFWHGANWTYLFWGLFHASLFVPLYLLSLNRKNIDPVAENKVYPSLSELGAMLLTFTLATVAWVFFRADTLSAGFSYIANACTNFSIAYDSSFFVGDNMDVIIKKVIWFIPILLVVEWINRTKEYGSEFGHKKFQKFVSMSALVVVFFYGKFDYQEFIYFQF